MGKLSFLAGLATGYVLGAKAGRQRYEQIARTSGKVWHSEPVQKQVERGKEAARTKAAPVVADMVADAARATGEKLRQGRTVASEAIASSDEESGPATAAAGSAASRTSSSGGDATDAGTVQDHTDAWSAATEPTSTSD
jgi:hypothetical protein